MTPLLLSCPRSDCVIPDTLIVFVTYCRNQRKVLGLTVWREVCLPNSCDRPHHGAACRYRSSVSRRRDTEFLRRTTTVDRRPPNSAGIPAKDPGPSSTRGTASRRIYPSRSASASADTACRLHIVKRVMLFNTTDPYIKLNIQHYRSIY